GRHLRRALKGNRAELELDAAPCADAGCELSRQLDRLGEDGDVLAAKVEHEIRFSRHLGDRVRGRVGVELTDREHEVAAALAHALPVPVELAYQLDSGQYGVAAVFMRDGAGMGVGAETAATAGARRPAYRGHHPHRQAPRFQYWPLLDVQLQVAPETRGVEIGGADRLGRETSRAHVLAQRLAASR